MHLTPYSIARSVWSSMSTFAMATRPFCFATAFSNLGPRILQGPHHLKMNTRQTSRRLLFKAVYAYSHKCTYIQIWKGTKPTSFPLQRFGKYLAVFIVSVQTHMTISGWYQAQSNRATTLTINSISRKWKSLQWPGCLKHYIDSVHTISFPWFGIE